MTGRVPSARRSVRAIERSRIERLKVGSSMAATKRAPILAEVHGVVADLGRVDGDRLVVAAPDGDRRVVAEQAHRRVGLAHGLLPDARGRSPTAAGGPARGAGPASSAASYSSGRVTWAWMRSRSSPAALARCDVGGELVGRRLGEGVPGRSVVRALQVEPLAVDRADPVVELDAAEPGAAGRAGGSRSSGASAGATSTTTSCSGWSPSAHGHQSAGRSTVTVHSTWFSPAASGCSSSWSAGPTDERMATVVGSAASRLARRTTTARSSLASRQRTRRSRIRIGPVSSMRTGRQMPPGFHVSSRQSQCWKTPVRLRFAVLSRCGAHVTSTARTCSRAIGELRGDVEGVGDEVALGVADVGAVEPDVALVEEAVEDEPAAPPPRRGGRLSNRRRCSSGPSLSANAAIERQWPGHGDRLPVAVVEVGLGIGAPQLVVGGRPPATCPRGPDPRTAQATGGSRP